MDILSFLLLCAGFVCSLALAFVAYHFVRFALNKVNVWRVSEDRKPFSNRAVAFLSVASALSFIL